MDLRFASDDGRDGLEFLALGSDNPFVDVRMTERGGTVVYAMTLDYTEAVRLRDWLNERLTEYAENPRSPGNAPPPGTPTLYARPEPGP